MQLTGPLSLFGCERTGELVKGQVKKDGLLVPDGIGLGLLVGSLRFTAGCSHSALGRKEGKRA